MVTSRQVKLIHVTMDRSGSSDSPLLTQAFATQFDPVGVVDDAIEDGVGQSRITDHLMMPRKLIGESLGSESLTRVIPCMAVAYRSSIVDQDVGLI